MIAGLLFATHDAEDGSSLLAATLPFGGRTLIEYQARLLEAAGATQIVVVVGRLTPELLGAVARIGRRGCTVDAVRTAGEAAAKMHPLARIIMLADGLVTPAETIARLGDQGGDALVVLHGGGEVAGLERLGDGLVWAGVARVSAARLAEVAGMPRDYDMQSTLMRTIAQAGAPRLVLEVESAASHGVYRQTPALEAIGRTMVEEGLRSGNGWFDRLIVAPTMRPVLTTMMRRGVGVVPLAGGVFATGLAGLLLLGFGQGGAGLLLVLLAVIAASGGQVLSDLRDEPSLTGALAAARLGFPLLALLLLGDLVDRATADQTGLALAVATSALLALTERASAGHARPRWDGGTGGTLALATLATGFLLPTLGLLAAATHAGLALAAAIERLRART